jgi:hypothetical protein
MITCIKQYGARRTGSSYIRAMIAANYSEVLPLIHILGDKHSPPVDLDHFLRTSVAAPDPDWEFVRAATLAAPAESTRPHDERQIACLRRTAARVADSVRRGTLGFAISCKNPYAWAASLARHSGWTVWSPTGRRVKTSCSERLAAACREYNRNYRAWLDLHARFPSRSILIRHEDLVEDARGVLENMERLFGFARLHPELRLIAENSEAVDWDDSGPALRKTRFNASFYRERRYMKQLSASLRETVEENIDWPVASALGYTKHPG